MIPELSLTKSVRRVGFISITVFIYSAMGTGCLLRVRLPRLAQANPKVTRRNNNRFEFPDFGERKELNFIDS
jgi:hypothetical protein